MGAWVWLSRIPTRLPVLAVFVPNHVDRAGIELDTQTLSELAGPVSFFASIVAGEERCLNGVAQCHKRSGETASGPWRSRIHHPPRRPLGLRAELQRQGVHRGLGFTATELH